MAAESVCSQASLAALEPLAATASRADNWVLVEYREAWPRDPLDPGLPEDVREHLRAQLEAIGPAKLLFLRRPERRDGLPLRVFMARASGDEHSLMGLEVERHEDLLGLELASRPGEPFEGPLVLVCGHGRRDPCCARFGPPVYDELRRGPLGDGVWQSSHLGGHRFAANVVLLPEGLMFGRVSPATATALVERYQDGEIDLNCYRGRCSYPPAAQAVERALREREGLLGIGDLELVGTATSAEVVRVRFRLGGSRTIQEFEVEETEGSTIPLSCGEAPEPTKRFLVRRS